MAKAKTKTPNDPAAFRALPPADQIRAIQGQKFSRLFEIERQTMDAEKRTAWLSIASEEPYERWWGVEILDLGRQSIRDKRLRLGAPLLVGHDPAEHIGVVEDFEISPDRKLRILARFGKGARAEEVWQDVLDGIRRNTSVGYVIHDMVLEKQEQAINTYRVTDWEPYEGSLVSVPADPTVGVGRNDSPDDDTPKPKSNPEETKMETQPNHDEASRKAASEAQLREQARVNALLAAGDTFAADGGTELARELIKDKDGTLEMFNARMLEKMRGRQKPTPTAEPAGENRDGSEPRILMRYSKSKAFTRDLSLQNGGVMKAEEAAYRAGKWVQAVVYGNAKAKRWCSERGIATHGIATEERVMTEGVNNDGGFLVPDEMESAIIDLRDEYGVARRLARVRQMGSNTRNIPRRAGGITAYFVNEDNSGVTASDKGWENVGLNAKTLAALGIMSSDYVEDAVIDVADDFAGEIALAFATKEDECFLNGDGTATYGGMHGLVKKFEATAYASRVDAVSGHDTAAEIDNTDLTSVMGAIRQFAKAGAVWLCSSTYEDVIFGRLKAAAGGNTMTDLAGRPVPSFLGYPIVTSESMLSALTAQNNKIMLMFGNFAQSSSFGARRGIMVQILRERYAEKLQIGIIGSERFDIVNHDVGTTTVKGPVSGLLGKT